MNANKVWLALMLLGLSLSSTLAGAAVSRQEGARWLAAYQAALEARAPAALDALIAEDVRIRVELEDASGARQPFTLRRARFIQQILALWRFASEQHYQFSRPEYGMSGNGELTVTVTQTEQRALFGVEGGQRDVLTLVLAHRHGVVQVVDLHSVSQLW